ncbi:MAG: hypothetical protein EPN99_03325 [Frankiales bacterium]|nr:MAG: hypothetical protein EPN99_03325 [Frankiales bacterium]
MKRALVLLPLLLLPACGGGDDGGEDVKASYVAGATGVCEGAVEDFEALVTPTTPEGFAPYADSLVGILEKAHDQLAVLTPPEADRARLAEKVIDPLAALVDEGKAYAARVRAAGPDQARLLALLSERPTADTIDVGYLRSYGLSACAEAVEKAG